MIIKYSKQNKDTTNVSLRGMKTECWKALKKLAALNELTISDYIDKIVREQVERLNK